jgi:hypothetical protein
MYRVHFLSFILYTSYFFSQLILTLLLAQKFQQKSNLVFCYFDNSKVYEKHPALLSALQWLFVKHPGIDISNHFLLPFITILVDVCSYTKLQTTASFF